MTPLAAHAAVRFGLGARLDAPVPDDPVSWLQAQIRPLPEAPGPSLTDCLTALRQGSADRRGAAYIRISRDEPLAWAQRMLTTDEPFAERWTNFWSNHFTVSRRSRRIRLVGGHYQRAVIRPHAFGRFEDLLLAVYRHPAMLFYLDQVFSVGPRSADGQGARRGLNENLARECMELHSVTPAAGYTQADVTALACVLTGWSVNLGSEAGEQMGFFFKRSSHEPGTKRLMGREFPEGEEGGVQALKFLANHPATHRALAVKLTRHFVGNQPPPAAVARVEAALRDSGGDLAAAARALVASPEAWTPLTRMRDGQDYGIAMLRAVGGPSGAPLLLSAMTRFNQAVWNAPAPIGWSDDDAEWAEPEQLMRRLDWAGELASRAVNANLEAGLLAETVLGPLARAETVTAARRAGSMREAVLLLLASPEAQRR